MSAVSLLVAERFAPPSAPPARVSRHPVERTMRWSTGERSRRWMLLALLLSAGLHLGVLAYFGWLRVAPEAEELVQPVAVAVLFSVPGETAAAPVTEPASEPSPPPAPAEPQARPEQAPAPQAETPRPPQPDTSVALPEPSPSDTSVASPEPTPVPEPAPAAETPAQVAPPPVPAPARAPQPPRRPPHPTIARGQPDRPAAAAASGSSTHIDAAPGAQSAAAAGPPLATTPARPVGGAIRPPPYPQSARRRSEQGRVLVHVEVGPDGTPISISLAASSGSVSLDEAALGAVRQSHFTPATRGGIPVAGAAEVPIVFRLE